MAYRQWLEAGVDEEELADIRRYIAQQRALGDERFQKMVEKTLNRTAVLPDGRQTEWAGRLTASVPFKFRGLLAPLAWIVMLACWAAAGASWMNARRRRNLHETRSNLDSLASISWQEFEMLVGESYRRQGYAVVENGLGGKDGGIDLIVSKDGRRELVQCKQWKRRQVDVATVREMWGLVEHHRAHAVHIVSTGNFTFDAARFAQGKHIYLVTGRELLDRIRMAQTGIGTSSESIMPRNPLDVACPLCSGEMVERRNRSNGERFLGCARFPQCRGTAPVGS